MEKTKEKIKKEAIEAIEISEHITTAKQKVCLAFAIPTVSASLISLSFHNPYVALVSSVPAFLSCWSLSDTIAKLMKLTKAKEQIKNEQFEEFVEEARTSYQVDVLNNIADVIEDELLDTTPEADNEDYFDDNFYL